MVKKSKDMANLFLAAKILGDTGGGEQPVLVTKNITENGIYFASADNADGYSQVTVDVAPPAPLSPTRSGATIYDYDGSVIATYTPEWKWSGKSDHYNCKNRNKILLRKTD